MENKTKITYDNIIYSLQKAGGISAYWSEISSRLATNGADVEFYGDKEDNIFAKPLKITTKKESKINYKILRYLDFRKKLSKGSLFHSSYYRIANQEDIVNITTVHDFTYEYYRSGLSKFIHTWQKKRAINKSDGIICVSENTKNDLLKFYPHIKQEKIKVIYNGVSSFLKRLENPMQHLRNRYATLREKRYILFVGDRSYYKNFYIAVECAKEENLFLVVVGGGKLNSDEIKGIEDKTFHFQGISIEELNILYNNAFCLLYPSSYEGFGIPILEAMKANCPVISVNISSIPEIARNCALLVDEIKKENFIIELKKLYNADFRNKLIQRGLLHVTDFTWDKCFKETIDFYKEVVGKISI